MLSILTRRHFSLPGISAAKTLRVITTAAAAFGLSHAAIASPSLQGLQGSYYSDLAATTLVAERLDPQVMFVWPNTPLNGMPANNFAVRWSGQLTAPETGEYTLHIRHDDDFSISVDGTERYTKNTWDGRQTAQIPLSLNANTAVALELTLKERGGWGRAQIRWSGPGIDGVKPVPNSALSYMPDASTDFDLDGSRNAVDNCPSHANADQSDIDGDNIGDACDSEIEGTGLIASYFSQRAGTSLVAKNIDTDINHDWQHGKPHPRATGNNFSVRWDGFITATESGLHTFEAGHDDWLELSIGEQSFNRRRWDYHRPAKLTVEMTAGEPLPISMMVTDTGGYARATLAWTLPGAASTSEIPASAYSWRLKAADQDGDGVSDDNDNCPAIANEAQKDVDQDSLGDACDTEDNRDTDNDGIQQFADNCPTNSNTDQADLDNDGTGDACDFEDNRDTDNDGVQQYADNCPSNSNADQADLDSDGTGDACDSEDNRDTDNDGVQQYADNCPSTSNASQIDLDSDGTGDACDTEDNRDTDNDGVQQYADNCPSTSNAGQADLDSDGAGDACDTEDNRDTDNDGVQQFADNCPTNTNADQADLDNDGYGDACDTQDNRDTDNDGVQQYADNCPTDSNTNQADIDSDGFGDACDIRDDRDLDGDGVSEYADNCPAVSNTDQADLDNDNQGDACDTQDNRDTDNDGVQQYADNCPVDSNASQADFDSDGTGDACDTEDNRDTDNDGVQQYVDNCPVNSNADQSDSDGDSIGDACDAEDNSPLATALRTGDSTLITAAQISSAITAEYSTVAPAARNAAWDAIYNRDKGSDTDETVSNINWYPTHDSAYFSNQDVGRNVPLLVTNSARRSDSPTSQPLAMARQNPNGSRTLIFGGSPFADLTNPSYKRSGTASGGLTQLLKNSIAWATQGAPALGELDVVIANLENYYWFPYGQGTREWFAEELPNATLNPAGGCDNTDIADCLFDADLLIIGVQEATDSTAMINAINAFQARGGAVLIQQSDHFTGLSKALMSNYGVAAVSNTSQSREVVNGSTAELVAEPEGDSILTMFNNLQSGSFVPNFNLCIAERTWLVNQTWRSCKAEPFNSGFRIGAEQLRSALGQFDTSGKPLFATPGLKLLKLYVMLGDKYRSAVNDDHVTAIVYPAMLNGDVGALNQSYIEAIFADTSVAYLRGNNLRQTDLGSLYCPERFVQRGTCVAEGYDFDGYQANIARLNNVSHGDQARAVTEWTTTGYSAMPGETVTVRRLDNSPLQVKAKLFYQRVGTSRTFSSTNRYSRPQYVESRYIPLPTDGSEVSISSPWGGPIYLHIQGSDALLGTPVEVEFSGVVRHLAILDAGNDDEVAEFVAEVEVNPLPTVDIRGEGFEAHMRRDKLLGALSQTYTLTMLLDEYRFDFIEPVYSLAGFKAPGKNMLETLSPAVRAICAANDWDCLNDLSHTRKKTQHANYDDHAHCGGGCAGNPWDSSGNVSPLGWLEGHELGHNLQRKHFNIHYVSADAGMNNDWGNYANRSGEVSNNVFPYYMKWRKYRVEDARPYTAAESDDRAREGHIKPLIMWAALQSKAANLTKTINGELSNVFVGYSRNADINKDGVNDHCAIIASYPVAETDTIANYSWKGGGIYDNNGERFSFYQGIPPMLDDQVMADGTLLDNGFEYITLMYEVSRIITEHGDNNDEWNAARDSIGFGLFPQKPVSSDEWSELYDGRDIRHMPGNDVIVVGLSYVTGIDFRPYFDLRQVRYSDLASQQVQAHVTSGRITRAVGDASMPHFMPVIDKRLPMANPADTPRALIDGNADTVWPDANMPNGGWTPMGCPLD